MLSASCIPVAGGGGKFGQGFGEGVGVGKPALTFKDASRMNGSGGKSPGKVRRGWGRISDDHRGNCHAGECRNI